ncbi:MAG: helix-turn-helix domain-containing protein [Bacteroidota bacterium]
MTQSTILREVSPEQITNLFEGLQNQLTELKTSFQPVKPTELLTRNEVSELLKCDLSTLHNWVKKGKLVPYGIGSRIYFKRTDIENALVYLGKKKGANNE